MTKNPRFLLTFGLVLMLLGIAIPFLIVIQILESTFFLNFFSWAISTLGLGLGMIGFTWLNKIK